MPGVSLNGPSLARPDDRLPGSVNVSFAYVEGEALMLHMKDVAVSTPPLATFSPARPPPPGPPMPPQVTLPAAPMVSVP